ncbi:MAG: ester cyclase [Porticoccaceae bacterium]|nr:ester cyclase [Porticoccaceae bacterium]
MSLYAEDCVFEDKALGLAHHGHQGIRDVFAFTFSIMPDFSVTYGDFVVGSDYAAVEWRYTGSFQGELEGNHYQGVPVAINGISFMVLRDGKILRNSDYWNLATLMEQLKK